MVFRYVVLGGYRGNKEKYGKPVSPNFHTYQEALHYKQTYSIFSLSVQEGEIKRIEKHGSIQ